MPTVCVWRQVCPSVLAALVELFTSTQGPSKWVAKANWAAISDPCAKGKVWQGLTCSTYRGMAIVTYVGASWLDTACVRACSFALQIAVCVVCCGVEGRGVDGAAACRDADA